MHYLWRAFKIAAMKKCRKAKNCNFNISTTNYHRSIDSLLMRAITSFLWHYNDVIMGAIVSQITSPTTAYSTVYLGADQRNIKALRHWPLWGEFTDSPHKWPVMRKMFPFDDVIMKQCKWYFCGRLLLQRLRKSKSGKSAIFFLSLLQKRFQTHDHKIVFCIICV